MLLVPTAALEAISFSALWLKPRLSQSRVHLRPVDELVFHRIERQVSFGL